jgi:hypothetical protein
MKTPNTSPLKVRRLTKIERSQITLSGDLKNIIVGLLMGDLNAQRLTKNSNALLKFEQGLINKDYLFHLYDLFKSYCLTAPIISDRLPDKRTGKIYTRVLFNTMSLPCFNEFLDLFYPEGKKIIPKNIGDLLTPLGLAYLICDDGTFDSKRNIVSLCTDSYLESDVEFLIVVLANKFDLKCRKDKHGNGFRIVILKSSLGKLQELVRSHIHSTMLYKIGL